MFDFENNPVVDSIDSVPEQARALYAEKDGKFHLVDALKPFASAYQGQTKALEKARKDLTTANGEAASRRVSGKALVDFLKENGVEQIDENDPITTLKTYTASMIDANKKNKDLPVNLDKIRSESERRIAEVNAAADQKTAKMQGTLNRYLISQAATAALAKAGGNVDLLLDKVEKQAKVVQEGDDFVVRIVDADGEVRSNGAGGYLDFDGLVADMKRNASFAVAFKSEDKGGTGHVPGSAAKQAPQRQGEMSSTDKISAGLREAEKARK
jgi:hypothetical protein